MDNCREGFIDGLKQAGFEKGKNLTIEYKNAQADGGLNNQIASALAGTNPDLICAIATPMAQACYKAAGKANIPVIYCLLYTSSRSSTFASRDLLSNTQILLVT